MYYPAAMRSGWWLLVGWLCAGSARASDDVGAILAGVTSARAPCADQIAALDAAVGADPQSTEPRQARGVCLYRLGRLELAWADLELGLAEPGGVTAIEPLVVGAILAARRGDHPRSGQWLGRAETLGGAAHPQVQRGRLVTQAVRGDLAGAWAGLDAALERTEEDPVLRVAATELISLDLDGATPRARAAVGRRVHTVTRHNRASGWLNAGQPAACLHEAEGALEVADPDEADAIAALQALAWRCGVAAAQVGPATRHLKAMGRDALAEQPAGTVIAHVRLLRDAGQAGSALKLLALVRPQSPADHQDVATLGVGLRTATGDLDGALAAAEGPASAVSRANLAKALAAAGRTADAVALLDRTCAELEQPAPCKEWRRHLAGAR